MEKAKETTIWEITLPGFDGSTDETNDRVIWIETPSNLEVVLSESFDSVGADITPINPGFTNGIDLIVRERKAK